MTLGIDVTNDAAAGDGGVLHATRFVHEEQMNARTTF